MVKLPFPQLVPPKYSFMGFAPGLVPPTHLHDRLQDVAPAFHDNLRPKLSGPCGRTSTEEDAEIDTGGSWGAARWKLALDNQLGDETKKKGTLKWTLGKGWLILVYFLMFLNDFIDVGKIMWMLKHLKVTSLEWNLKKYAAFFWICLMWFCTCFYDWMMPGPVMEITSDQWWSQLGYKSF